MKNLVFKNSHKIFKKKPFLININEPKKKCKNNLFKKIRDINMSLKKSSSPYYACRYTYNTN